MKIDLDAPQHQEIGFNRSLSNAEISLMVDQVKAVRDVIGEYMPLAIDCHGKFGVNDTIKLVHRLEASFGGLRIPFQALTSTLFEKLREPRGYPYPPGNI